MASLLHGEMDVQRLATSRYSFGVDALAAAVKCLLVLMKIQQNICSPLKSAAIVVVSINKI